MYFLLLIVFIVGVLLLGRKLISEHTDFKLNSKVVKYAIIPFFSLSLIASMLLYLHYDKKSCYYGSDSIFCNQSMPFGISAKSGDYAGGLVLVDDADFELVGKGFRYENTDFKTNDFLAFGYNDTSIIVKCTDSLETIKYLTSYKTGYKSKRGNDEISFRELSVSEFYKRKEKYAWIIIDEERIAKIPVKKNWLLIGMAPCLFFLIREIVRLRKQKVLN